MDLGVICVCRVTGLKECFLIGQNHLSVFDLFSEHWQSTLVQIFFFFLTVTGHAMCCLHLDIVNQVAA